MLYIVLLFIFNISIIILLANVKLLPKDTFLKRFTKYHLEKPMMLVNRDISISEIEIDKYHSIRINFDKEQKNES